MFGNIEQMSWSLIFVLNQAAVHLCALVAEDQFTLVVECSHGTSLVVAKVAVHVRLLVQHAMQSHHFERIRSKCFGRIVDHQW